MTNPNESNEDGGTMTTDLLPCPFCGADASKHENDDGGSYISCNHCNASSHLEYGRKENLIDVWNRRATQASIATPQPQSVPIDIGQLVDRFLGWKLPKDFNPDCGISFKHESDYEHPTYGRNKFEPIGTNLFSADQARKMFEYVLGGITTRTPSVHVISDSHHVYIALSQAVAGQLIYIRDKLLLEDIQEAYHALYCIADPNLSSTEPWKRLEDIAAGKALIERLSADEHKSLTKCASDRDGECYHTECPQLRDDEPSKTGRHCPLDKGNSHE